MRAIRNLVNINDLECKQKVPKFCKNIQEDYLEILNELL